MFVLGYCLENGISVTSFFCVTSYPELGALASGIGISGYVLSGLTWGFFASKIANPGYLDSEIFIHENGVSLKYYPKEVTDNLPDLFKAASIICLTLIVLIQFLVSDPPTIKENTKSLILSVLAGDLSK